jgi:hypothetical protein
MWPVAVGAAVVGGETVVVALVLPEVDDFELLLLHAAAAKEREASRPMSTPQRGLVMAPTLIRM